MAEETRLLIDRSVLLEFLLNQERADEVARFFEGMPRATLYITDLRPRTPPTRRRLWGGVRGLGAYRCRAPRAAVRCRAPKSSATSPVVWRCSRTMAAIRNPSSSIVSSRPASVSDALREKSGEALPRIDPLTRPKSKFLSLFANPRGRQASGDGIGLLAFHLLGRPPQRI